ncbi:uncharacterized protein ACIBXB_012284 isoform 5-T5 [Morphnus guianensis]
MDAGPPRVIGGCPAAWPVCQRGVCAARAGTVLTIRKQLHPALRGQDHCPGTYQEPSSDPFQKRTLPASMCDLPLHEPGCTGSGCHLHGSCSRSVSAVWTQCWNMSTDKRRKVASFVLRKL